MLDLDEAEKLPDYQFKHNGKVLTFDTILIVSKMAKEIQGVTEPDVLRDKVSLIFGEALNTNEALLILHDFETFADQYENSLKKCFGRSQSSTTITEPVQKNTDGSAQS